MSNLIFSRHVCWVDSDFVWDGCRGEPRRDDSASHLKLETHDIYTHPMNLAPVVSAFISCVSFISLFTSQLEELPRVTTSASASSHLRLLLCVTFTFATKWRWRQYHRIDYGETSVRIPLWSFRTLLGLVSRDWWLVKTNIIVSSLAVGEARLDTIILVFSSLFDFH